MRRGKAKKEKAPLGVTLEKVATLSPHRCRWPGWWWDDDDLEDGDVGLVRIDPWIGRSLASIETTFSQSDYVTTASLNEISSLLRGHRLRAPLVAGLVALRGRAPSESSWYHRDARGNPQHRDNPIRCIALCVGGSHALVYQPNCLDLNHTGGLLPFREDSKMKKLREFLDDKRVVVACLGAAKVVKKLAEEWGLHVARPRELTDLFAHAYGKGIGVKPEVLPGKPPNPKRDYSWMSIEAAKRARAHAEVEQQLYEEKSKPGRWIPKVIEDKVLSMEYMARVALGEDMRLAPWPAKRADVDWGRRGLDNDHCMYATRDAYLCFDIAAHCLPKIGEPVG